MVVRQFGQLPSRGVDQALLSEAYAHAPEPSHGLDVLLSLIVIDANPLASVDHDRTHLLCRRAIVFG